MPTFIVQGKPIEVGDTDFYLYWYRLIDTVVQLSGYFYVLPNIENWGAPELDQALDFIRANTTAIEDAELRELAGMLAGMVAAMPLSHLNLLRQVTAQFGIANPASPKGKREFEEKWDRLLAGQAETEAMRQALAALQAYTAWVMPQVQEIQNVRDRFQQRIIALYPEVAEKLRNP